MAWYREYKYQTIEIMEIIDQNSNSESRFDFYVAFYKDTIQN